MRHRFEDIAVNSTAKRKPIDEDMQTYIGLEHLDAGDMYVTRFGSKVPIKGEKLIMTKGDVLFGRRNTYLKRAAVAPHDGLFSAHGMVLRPKTDIVTEKFFPLFIASDYFFDSAIRISVGSISPTVNWGQLRELEFDLPPLDEQDAIAEVLWAMIETKNAYKRLLSLTDELVKSQFIEMFGEPTTNLLRWEVDTIGNLTTSIVAGESLNGEAREKLPGEKAVLKVSAVTYGYFKSDEYKVLLNPDENRKNIYPQAGDLLFSRANTRELVGATALVEQDYPDLILPDKLWRLLFDNRVLSVYMKFVLSADQIRLLMSEMATGTSGSMFNISMEKLRGITIPVPPLALQHRFADFARAADKSKFELNRTLDDLDAAYKALARERLG
jgi:type I restriction enzyme S subunit